MLKNRSSLWKMLVLFCRVSIYRIVLVSYSILFTYQVSHFYLKPSNTPIIVIWRSVWCSVSDANFDKPLLNVTDTTDNVYQSGILLKILIIRKIKDNLTQFVIWKSRYELLTYASRGSGQNALFAKQMVTTTMEITVANNNTFIFVQVFLWMYCKIIFQ